MNKLFLYLNDHELSLLKIVLQSHMAMMKTSLALDGITLENLTYHEKVSQSLQEKIDAAFEEIIENRPSDKASSL